MPPPCTACRSADSSPRNFLLTCIQCSCPWHHRCHRPVITDKELVNIIKLFNTRGPNAPGPKRLEWTCAACLKGKGAAAGGSGSISTERPRAISTNERAGSASRPGGASGSSLNVTRPQQAPVAAKSNTTIRPPPPTQARKHPSATPIDDDDDEIQIIEKPRAAASCAGSSTFRAPVQPPRPQPQPQAQSQPRAPVPTPTLPRPPLPTNSVKSAAAAQPPRSPAPSIARPKSNSTGGPSPTAPPSASCNAILPSSTPTHSARQLETTPASASATVDPLPKPTPAPVPPAQPSSPKPQSVRTQHAAKSAGLRPQAAKKAVRANAPVAPQPTSPPTPKPTPGPSTAVRPPGARVGAGGRVMHDLVSFPLSTAPAPVSSARTMAAPTGAAAAAAYSPAPPPSGRGRFHPMITVHRGADEREDEEELEDELDVDEDGDEEDMLKSDRNDARTASGVSASKTGLAPPPPPRDNASAPPVPGPSYTRPRRLPEWINARAEASDKPPAQDMWARRAFVRRRSAPTRSDITATPTAPGNVRLPLPSRRARKTFRVVHRPAGGPPVDKGKGKAKGKEKEGLAPAAAQNPNLMFAAPFFFTADAWTVKRMAELGV